MKTLGIFAALAAGALAMPALDHGQPVYIRPEERRVKGPSMSRDKRKRLARTLSGGHRRRGPHSPLPHILHAVVDGVAVCKPGIPIGHGPHRPASAAPTCNDCQRAIWKANGLGLAAAAAGAAIAAGRRISALPSST
jgi:hypothetical protein